jgi:hypothetical protein
MVLNLLLSLSLFQLSQAGTEKLPNNMILTWSINNDNFVAFELQVPVTSVSNFDYWGVGIKQTKDGIDMSQADIVTVIKAS